MEFNRRYNYNDLNNLSMLALSSHISNEDYERLNKMRIAFNFYDGFHWEDIPAQDKPEITENYCRTYVNKFIAFEFGRGFNFKTDNDTRKKSVNEEGQDSFDYLNSIWEDNKQELFCTELGQMKSITGEGWVQVKYYSPEQIKDPYGKYPKGRIRVSVIPSAVVFPIYDQHEKDDLIQLTIQYPIEIREETPIMRRTRLKTEIYKQIWTTEKVEIWEGGVKTLDIPNTYGVIPFVQIKNLPVAGRNEGLSDLDDLIPLNMELNMKKSDISEIIDYHSAPITIIFGAKIGSLEKGANKIWGGLPKESKVENLKLEGDLTASVSYTKELKLTMSEIAGVPEGALGGTQAISNTSGIALQYSNLPLTEKTKLKKRSSKVGLEEVNRLILLISLQENLISIPEGVTLKQFYYNEVTIPDSLPKDLLIELQAIEQEMRLGLENRKGAMTRLNREDIDLKLADIDRDREENPEIYDIQETQVNSGITNGQTNIEKVRKEIQGKNG